MLRRDGMRARPAALAPLALRRRGREVSQARAWRHHEDTLAAVQARKIVVVVPVDRAATPWAVLRQSRWLNHRHRAPPGAVAFVSGYPVPTTIIGPRDAARIGRMAIFQLPNDVFLPTSFVLAGCTKVPGRAGRSYRGGSGTGGAGR